MIKELENLVKTHVLEHEEPAQKDIDGFLASGVQRLRDAENTALSLESRFDLAYNAAFALALAALRWHGYRPKKDRYIVFQALPHTTGKKGKIWLVLDLAHNKRNRSEYDAIFDVKVDTVEGVIQAAREIEKVLHALGPVKGKVRK